MAVTQHGANYLIVLIKHAISYVNVNVMSYILHVYYKYKNKKGLNQLTIVMDGTEGSNLQRSLRA